MAFPALTAGQEAIRAAFPPPSVRRLIGWVWLGQSNQQGAALQPNGVGGARIISKFRGITDPFRMNANGGGSCLPHLLDLGLERNVEYLFLNGAIGGAEIAYFPGRVGATIVNPSGPATILNANGSSMSASTAVAPASTICRPGEPGFDPFDLLDRCRAEMLKYPQVTEWIVSYANAESDGGTSLEAYRDSHLAIADYFLGLNAIGLPVKAYFAGLSSSGGNTPENMDRLSAGVEAALAILRAQGKPAFKGGDLYKLYGMRPPVYKEVSDPNVYVHLVEKGQMDNAEIWNEAVAPCGF